MFQEEGGGWRRTEEECEREQREKSRKRKREEKEGMTEGRKG